MPNVFLIGIPGCGKSVVYRVLAELLRAEGFKGDLMRIDDFPILKDIFERDKKYERHRPTPGGGLKVTDDTVWDDLSRALNQQALKLQRPDRLLFIEFSRDNYLRAFKHFDPEILRDSLVIYIDCPWDLAWERNLRRAELEAGLDAHLVSREEMEKTYARDDHRELLAYLDVPMLIVKNDTDDIEMLKTRLKKIVGKLKLMLK